MIGIKYSLYSHPDQIGSNRLSFISLVYISIWFSLIPEAKKYEEYF